MHTTPYTYMRHIHTQLSLFKPTSLGVLCSWSFFIFLHCLLFCNGKVKHIWRNAILDYEFRGKSYFLHSINQLILKDVISIFYDLAEIILTSLFHSFLWQNEDNINNSFLEL